MNFSNPRQLTIDPNADSAFTIESIEAAVCSLELPYPVRLGSAVYSTRDYIAVKMRGIEGHEGYAFGYTRGLPLLPMLEQLGVSLVRTDARDHFRSLSQVISPSARVSWSRAASLSEIAAWDLISKVPNLSLAQLLGVRRVQVPVMAVGGYFRVDRGNVAVLDELAALAAEGYQRLKIMAGSLDNEESWSFLRQARRILPESIEVAVDVHYSLRNAERAARLSERLANEGVWLLEDPFLPTEWRNARGLSGPNRARVAMGEDVSDSAQFIDLLEVVDVLRVDPTTCGGIRSTVAGLEAAASIGTPVIPHVFSTLSLELALAFPIIDCIEYIPPATKSDPIEEFLTRPLTIANGAAVADDSSGVGMALDWDELMKYAIQHTEVTK